jgi:hypothetical protein
MLSLTSIASSSFIIIYISAVHGIIFQRYIITFFKWISWRQNAIGRRVWTNKAISIKLISRSWQFHWMIGAIIEADRGKTLLPLGPFSRIPFGDLLVSDGDSSIGDGESFGGRFHTGSSSICPYQLWTWTESLCALPCFCDRLRFWALVLCCSFLFWCEVEFELVDDFNVESEVGVVRDEDVVVWE